MSSEEEETRELTLKKKEKNDNLISERGKESRRVAKRRA